MVDMFFACRVGDIEKVRALIAQDPSLVNTRSEHSGLMPIQEARSHGHEDIVKLLIEHGAEAEDLSEAAADTEKPTEVGGETRMRGLARVLRFAGYALIAVAAAVLVGGLLSAWWVVIPDSPPSSGELRQLVPDQGRLRFQIAAAVAWGAFKTSVVLGMSGLLSIVIAEIAAVVSDMAAKVKSLGKEA